MILKLFIAILVINIILLRLRLRSLNGHKKIKDTTSMCMDKCAGCRKQSKCHDTGKIIRIF